MSELTHAADVTLRGSFRFQDQPLFEELEFTLRAGEWTCLIGVSGAGKSTLLRLIAGLETGGKFEGIIATSQGESLEGKVAYMAQSDLLLPWLTLTDNIALGHRLRNQPLDDQRLADLIDRVGLTAHRDKKPPALSGGMRQRAALARTLLENTPIVLLDEPFSALDARTRSSMQELAYELLREKTVLLVTHDPSEAVRMGHRLFEVSDVGVAEHGVPNSVPIRAVNDPVVLARQAELLLTLRD
ncbi:MAG: ABC transporter ATP-binding protein [Granulosicoccus sp.]|nr:ABC transporter ATP-binding protein [Granulosicoccus sp.]